MRPMTVCVKLPGEEGSVWEFAHEELRRHLGSAGVQLSSGDADLQLELSSNPQLPAGAWELSSQAKHFAITGCTPSAALHGVYTMLEELGWRFEVTGPIAPEQIHWDRLGRLSGITTPAVARRGIRQHINFPMDISAWPPEQAKEYIRNLARLRFNFITFHSYPSQWVAVDLPGKPMLAGEFFYGEEHRLPPLASIRCRAGNTDRWCIPDIEPLLDAPEARSRAAQAWLREVMAEAKRVGMHVQFSFEPRSRTTDLTDTLATAHAILRDYPDIDTLELMTQEVGGWGKALALDDLRQALEQVLPAQAMQLPSVQRLIGPQRTDLQSVLGETAHNLLALTQLEKQVGDRVELSLGVYCAMPEYLESVTDLWRSMAPADCGLALLSGHGAGRVYRHLPSAKLRADELSRVTVYSWAEFDGLMYLQQDDTEGLASVMEYLHSLGGGRLQCLAVNHWRVAENAWTIRYTAESTIKGRLTPREFRWQSAEAMGIVDPARVRLALAQLAALTDSAYDLLPNAGFCFYGCWRGPYPMGYLLKFSKPRFELFADLYAQTLATLTPCRADRPAGTAWLELMRNRLLASERYLRALIPAIEMASLVGTGKACDCPAEHRARAIALAEQSLSKLLAVIELMVGNTPDRASLGNLISMYHVTYRFVREILDQLIGRQPEATESTSAGKDAPASPILA